jgi:predicted dinucleotide-utilizing enzyme
VSSTTPVAVAGLGAIGRVLARRLCTGMPGVTLACAAARDHVKAVRLITRKPPRSLSGGPYLVANSISVEGLNAPKLVFSGSARVAAAGFPANVNVAAALALAGIGPDRTLAEIWADPALDGNCHTVEVDSDRLASPYRSRISLRTIPGPDGSRRSRCWRHYASSPRHCELELELSLCK